MSQHILLKIQDNTRQYQDLLTQGEVFVEQSAQLLDRLLPQQVAVDQSLQQELDNHQQLQTQAEQEAQQLQTLQELSSCLGANRSFEGISSEQINKFNQSLAPYQLEIRYNSSGQITYWQAGQEVTEKDFKTILLQALSQQGEHLQQTHQHLAASADRVSELRRQSESVSQQIQTANQTLTQGLGLIEQAHGMALQNREQLMLLRNSPELWAQLSPEQQNQVLILLSQIEADLTHSENLTIRGQDYLHRSEEQLEQSSALRQRVDHILDSSLILLNHLETVLQEHWQIIAQLQEQLKDLTFSHEWIQDLIHHANELESKLILAPGPDFSQLRQFTREWAERLDEIAQEFRHLQRNDVLKKQIQRQYFEQSANMLREQLAYHEQALDKINELRHEQLKETLSHSIKDLKQYL